MKFAFKEWQENWAPELVERDFSIKETMPKNINKIITFTGARRTGKTYLMFRAIKQLEDKVNKNRIFYLNFEDERIEQKKETLTNLIPQLFEMYGEKDYYLFLDEIQTMPSWDKWLRRVYDKYKNFHFFVSGSTSKLSLKEIPKSLRGRTLNHPVFPLSFPEFLNFKNIELEKGFRHSEKKLSEVKKALKNYLKYGGFPEVVLENEEQNKKRLIQEYFRTIVALDLGEKYNIQNLTLLSDLLKLMLNSTMFSHNKMFNTLKSMGKKVGKGSMVNYVKKAEEIYFCYLLPIFSYKIKDQMQYPKKLYFIDNGFINYVGLKFSKNWGRLCENCVAIELKRRAEEIYYWKNKQGKEVDFVVKEGTNIRQLIQVCYNMDSKNTRQRETKSLLKASKELNCKDLIIITWDYKGHEEFKNKTVKFIPLWEWLLGNN